MKATYLENYKNYEDLVVNNRQTIYTSHINRDNYANHFISVLNIMKDHVEEVEFKKALLNVVFADNEAVEMSIPDYFYNLIMWILPLTTNDRITSYHLFYSNFITKWSIKWYIDDKYIAKNRKLLPNIKLNNGIADSLSKFKLVDKFAMYLANTVNLEDTIELMNLYDEVDKIIHLDISNIPLEEIKDYGMLKVNELKKYIINSKHCLSDFFKSGEGLNIKQFKEFSVNGGTKPDGRKGVFPAPIRTNLITGGMNDPLSWYIEENVGRISQIVIDKNVGISGAFARLLDLNCIDTTLHEDPDYICNTHNFEEIVIENRKMLNKFKNRYFRFSENGIEYRITQKDIETDMSSINQHLPFDSVIGKKIYLRSPMTCASFARGEGICYRCYGDLAHTNKDINIGKLAAEENSSELTQKMLSVKHILESKIKKIKWKNQNEFDKLFNIQYNIIQIDNLLDDLEHYKLIINKDNLSPEDDFDYEYSVNTEYNEYVSEFEILTPSGELLPFSILNDNNHIYLTQELNDVIREKAQLYDETRFSLNFSDLEDIPIFIMAISNLDLSDTLYTFKNLLNNKDRVKQYDRHSLLQELIRTIIKGDMGVDAVHTEILLANQLRDPNYIFDVPQWEYKDVEYTIFTLNKALSNNPSISVSLMYQSVGKTFYNPLSYKKHKPSFIDLFFMEKPQLFLADVNEEEAVEAPVLKNGLRPLLRKVKTNEE